MSTLFVPGRGVVDLATMRLDAAVREYDERLTFATHPHTGQPTVFIKMEADADTGVQLDGSNVMPVLAFPHGTEPDPEFVKRELYMRDSLRHGLELLDDIRRNNDALRREHQERASEAAGILAEARESYLHDQGQTPYRRVLRPLKQTAVKHG